MKIKLTKRWKRSTRSNTSSSRAYWGSIVLECKYDYWFSSFYGKMFLMGADFKGRSNGPLRKSAEAAKQDAEGLAVELLLDIRDGTRILMKQYSIDMDEDD